MKPSEIDDCIGSVTIDLIQAKRHCEADPYRANLRVTSAYRTIERLRSQITAERDLLFAIEEMEGTRPTIEECRAEWGLDEPKRREGAGGGE